ncbi:MAG: Glycosyl transferase family 11 [Candidatus Wolfebacteria bacterium GW2011_GWE1_48_7]|uniref:Glycosyl transferase family 11 n=2 Tax=Candidatus Wolfeibacteriota TaxID=1752735 RepID=A0A0G1U731_9BACT|nr:MAG: glycosyl transferase family protein [Candidatus Wolfebacteria bacterium GW2011_GWB1_47_1]KKU59895.1 MAG: Glycosyl transferase family 11 [Candidatus Wolfebacteria bacterium GW2011_GWE2_47_12]KKU65887.1 MAG: Glycosyl transferase family 11 [Candidatus Wolfebacteria bacterium GW2011_GWD2_47_17]KKU75137.1 MAG: Glycosyl transferase family 11 [Candidatus Wolfebacteria bacterium GW2011_GWA1_47_6]KKU89926.1 MAG: Glycosyl transferase family 11 [Candidatus Wolfebacteria bacterium GW2011_GWA2_47_9b
MIIIKLKGGLGNQMFQYACAKHLAERNNDILRLDLSWYDPGGIPASDTVRQYALSNFAISAQAATAEEVGRMCDSLIGRLIKKIINKFRPITSYVFNPKILEQTGDVYMEGFFQSERYFKDIEFIVRNEFQLKDVMGRDAHAVLEDIEQSNAVSLHVRRGDYVNNKNASAFHGICSPAYYRAAIDTILKRIDLPKFFVFSDDIEWVKEHIEIPNATYVSDGGIRDYEELILMSKCKHAIIANSSFSWWGAWLNANPHKIVIAPRQWVSDSRVDTSDAVPSEWIRL